MAAIVIGLLAAGLPALALQSHPAKRVVHTAAPKSAASAPKNAPKSAPNSASTPADQTATVGRRKAAARAKGNRPSAVPNAYAAMPEAERLAIQSDLAWVGDYEGAAGGDFDERVIAAVKLFQKSKGGKETGILSEQERMLLAAAAQAPQEAVGWQVIDDPATGARIGLPEKLVPRSAPSRTGSRWTSGHGQIQIETFRLREAALAALFEEEKKTPRQRRAESSVLKPDSFVISGAQGLKRLLVRAAASGGEVRGITILYDQATEGIMAPVAVAMANTFQGFPDPRAGPPPGRKRGVEYGTAVVVDRSGDLLALRQVTDECTAIIVPGFGHAERLAEDAPNDLALIRLYGARNLVPAPLGGDSGKADQLTLVGIADPVAQDGGDAVSTAAARLTAQGVEPAPTLGFAGAAAIDAQGRFAGIVDLKSLIVAGIGPATQQASLIPAETVRGFLAAHGITPIAGHDAIDRSVVRVICVRK